MNRRVASYNMYTIHLHNHYIFVAVQCNQTINILTYPIPKLIINSIEKVTSYIAIRTEWI